MGWLHGGVVGGDERVCHQRGVSIPRTCCVTRARCVDSKRGRL